MSQTPTSPIPPVIQVIFPKRRRWVTFLLSLVLLGSGFIIGSGVTLVVGYRVIQHRLRHPEELPDRAVARLRKPLNLSNEQAREIKTILRKHLAELQQMRRRWQPEIEAQLDSIEQDVAGVLNPDQADKWHAIARERRHTWLPPLPPPPRTQPSEGK
jgi:hypothetical protein